MRRRHRHYQMLHRRIHQRRGRPLWQTLLIHKLLRRGPTEMVCYAIGTIFALGVLVFG